MRRFSRIVSLLLALSFCFAVAALAVSCGEEEAPCTQHVDNDGDAKCDECGIEIQVNDKSVYTVTVKDDSGKAVAGVKIKLTSGSNSSGTATTDDSGVASTQIEAEGPVFANIESVPEGYVAEKTKVDFEKGSSAITVTLKKVNLVTYTVKVVDGDGKAMSDVYVQICEGETCKTPVKTDKKGEAEFKFAPTGGTLKSCVTKMPEGYGYSGNEDEHGYVYFESGSTEITLTIIKN